MLLGKTLDSLRAASRVPASRTRFPYPLPVPEKTSVMEMMAMTDFLQFSIPFRAVFT